MTSGRNDKKTRRSLAFLVTVSGKNINGVASLLMAGLIGAVCIQQPARAVESQPVMQTSLAESVGTATNIRSAMQTLLEQFDQAAAGKSVITLHDLERVARIRDNDASTPIEDAARFFLVSPLSRLLASANGRDEFSRGSLKKALDGDTFRRIRQMGAGGDRKSLGMVLRDPGVPAGIRAAIVARLSDQQMLTQVGPINAQGSPQDKADETTAFLFLARLSWLGYAEAEAISQYKVPYTMTRGADDHSSSYWDNKSVKLSDKMLSGGTGIVNAAALAQHIGVFAHESGHAIFHFSGLQDRLNADCKALNLTPGVNSIINEAVAGVMQGRAHVAIQGYDKNRDLNLVIAHDVEKNLVDDQTFYARYYHVNTVVARAQMPQIRQLLANDIVPFFQQRFSLLGDPQLAQTLPPARDYP